MGIKELLTKKKPGRKVRGIAAVLLPYAENGKVAVDAFQRHLLATHRAGLMNAVNMDTGYVNYLSDDEQLDVLRWTTETLGKNTPFIAGVYIEGRAGDVVALYRRQMEVIANLGGIPILFQASGPHVNSSAEKFAVSREACRGFAHVLCSNLGRMFAPIGEIFDEGTAPGLTETPETRGMKPPSLGG